MCTVLLDWYGKMKYWYRLQLQYAGTRYCHHSVSMDWYIPVVQVLSMAALYCIVILVIPLPGVPGDCVPVVRVSYLVIHCIGNCIYWYLVPGTCTWYLWYSTVFQY
jgi:hypothetical protein